MSLSLRELMLPLDGSALAEQALPVAERLARRAGAVLHLVSVHTPLSPLVLASAGAETTRLADREALQWLRDYLDAKTDALRGTGGLEVRSALLEGTPATALAQYAGAKEIGLTILTTHGHGGLSRLWLGSVADRLLCEGARPVLALHPQAQPQPMEFHRVLVGVDGEPHSQAVLEAGVTLGSSLGVERYTLVQVIQPPFSSLTGMTGPRRYIGPTWMERRRAEVDQELDRLAEPYRTRGVLVSSLVVVAAAVAGQLIELARSTGTDLVAIGTHGARGIERLILGSVADKVVRGASQPVLVVPVPASSIGDQPGTARALESDAIGAELAGAAARHR
ncbi:MAG TPA: universal stress protein [Gemmatimonadales bacterium]|nr:universal stress protein [Gemmatimonadales bacterium]